VSEGPTTEPLFGPYGGGDATTIGRLRDSGANAVWFHGFDAAAFEACASAGVAACVELKTLRADFARRGDLVPIGADGRPIRYGRLVQGVCLSKTDFLDEIAASLREGLDAFAPAGVWLDYLSGAGWFETPDPDLQESCFCGDCVEAFCRAAGVDAEGPPEILARHAEAWTRHQCERVAAFGARLAEIVRRRRPGCLVGAYMCPWRPEEFDGALRRIFAQDYALLAEVVDVFTPLIYASRCGRPASWAGEFLARSSEFVPPGARVQLILDALDFPDSLLAAAEADPPTWGVQVFGGRKVFDDPERAKVFAAAAGRIRRRVGPAAATG